MWTLTKAADIHHNSNLEIFLKPNNNAYPANIFIFSELYVSLHSLYSQNLVK